MNLDIRSGRNRFLDVLKGIAIIFIVITHEDWTPGQRLQYLFPFWIDQAVSIFMIITGIVYSASLAKVENPSITQGLDPNWGGRKLIRYTIPYLIAYLINIVPYLFLRRISVFEAVFYLLVGGMGPGSYYYPVMVQLVFLFPCIYILIKKYKGGGLALCFLLDALYELYAIAFRMGPECYRLLVFRYIFLIAIGSYAFLYHRMKKNVQFIALIIGFAYVYLRCYHNIDFIIVNQGWAGTSYMGALLSGPVICALVFCLKNVHNRFLEWMGRASFNIFLTQMVYYTMAIGHVRELISNIWLRTGFNLLVCLVCGLAFYEIEHRFTDWVLIRYHKRVSLAVSRFQEKIGKLSEALERQK